MQVLNKPASPKDAGPRLRALPPQVARAIKDQQEAGEILATWVQTVIVALLLLSYLLSPLDRSGREFQPVPLVLALYTPLLVARIYLAHKRMLDAALLFVSICVEVAVLCFLIWALHIHYDQTPAFSLRATTFMYLFAYVALRGFRYQLRYVVFAGAIASAGWMLLVFTALANGGSFSFDFVAYATDPGIVSGPVELDRILALLIMTGVCAIGVWRFRRLLTGAISTVVSTQEELQQLAYQDLLTGLMNRRSFYDALGEATGNDKRRSGRQFTILYLDVDRFKEINDTLGHDAGDVLLQQVARRLEETIRRTDQVFRLGGDEFVILTDVANPIDAGRIAEKLIENLRQPLQLAGYDQAPAVRVDASVGICVYPQDGGTPRELTKNADLAMYRAKNLKTGFCFYTPDMNARALQRLQLESALHQAVAREDLALMMQPLVQAHADGFTVGGFEALLRWHSPRHGQVAPSDFIPIAEQTRLIVPIGHWVLAAAVREINQLNRETGRRCYVAVNLSPVQLYHPELPTQVRKLLDEQQLDPEVVQFEITEGTLMDDPDEAVRRMGDLTALGFHFAVDDFGTGYSSLRYLQRLPIRTLKIDRSFVELVETDAGSREIVRVVISLARGLGITTLAEGIETPGQRDFLLSEGCELMQGYLFGRPLPAAEVAAWVTRQVSQPPQR